MEKHRRKFGRSVNRRDFLALTTAGGLAAVAPSLPGQGGSEVSSSAENITQPLDTGGIAIEHFEAARHRAAALVSKMTLKEKISQFGAHAPAIPRLNIPAFNYYASEALHGLIHLGPVTSFPLPLAIGCSWNRSLVERVYTAVSDEIWAWHKKTGEGLAMFSPPTVNMGTRDPRWGRIAENFSEDPYLVGQMAIHTIRGMQGNDPRYLKTIACAKHFIANDTEDDREETSATVDARSFWEYYTRGFEACVREGHVFTVMSSYNALNGIPTTASRFLLTDLLRRRWGFRGYVVSDCDAVGDICRTHKFVPTYAEAAALAVNAGCDINCGLTLPDYLDQAVAQMLISESVLDHSLIRSFTGRILLGEFNSPEENPYHKIPVSCLESPAHRELAREIARQCIVLFKNENRTLPLDKTKVKKIAVIGPMADECHLGNYSGTPEHRVSPLEGINAYLGVSVGASYRKTGGDFFRAGAEPGKGLFAFAFGPRLQSSGMGTQALGFLASGSWASFHNVQLTGANEFHARVSSGPLGFPGRSAPSGMESVLEAHLDSLKGPIIAKLRVPYTGGWQNWLEASGPLRATEGLHTLYVVSAGEPGSVFSLESFWLTPEGSAPTAPEGAPQVLYAMGCTVVGKKNEAQFAEAVKAAKEADVALVFVGADQQVDREAHDRHRLDLPGAQHELVRAVYGANPRAILVMSSNCPVAVNWEQEHLPAIVGGLFLGQEQGNALADVLFGQYNPGGKVSTTWYRRVEDLPDFHDYDVRNGRTYMYFQGDPLYAFGHGLSYTSFRYENLRLSQKTLRPGSQITISLEVTNSGPRDGDEVVQVYIHVAAGTVIRPIQQLVNFERIHLEAGESKTVRFELSYDDKALRYWDESKYDFVAIPGPVDLRVGSSSADIRLRTQFHLAS